MALVIAKLSTSCSINFASTHGSYSDFGVAQVCEWQRLITFSRWCFNLCWGSRWAVSWWGIAPAAVADYCINEENQVYVVKYTQYSIITKLQLAHLLYTVLGCSSVSNYLRVYHPATLSKFIQQSTNGDTNTGPLVPPFANFGNTGTWNSKMLNRQNRSRWNKK